MSFYELDLAHATDQPIGTLEDAPLSPASGFFINPIASSKEGAAMLSKKINFHFLN